MAIYENHDIEFKQEYVAEINKEVIAFANASGGTILIGIQNNGIVCGVADPDDTMLRVANSIKDTISPDIMPFVTIRSLKMEKKNVVEIIISTGTNRPYYLKGKGLKPSGVYIRKGSASLPVSDEGIREMIVKNSGHSYESERSINQELTFEDAKKEFRKRDIELDRVHMKTLKMIGDDDLYTNLAFLLSDQCLVSTKVAIFQGSDKAIFRTRRIFDGSLLRQMEDVFQFLDYYNQIKATFSGLNRIDIRDYPEEAVREAWLNCLVHSDYSVSGSTIINVYDDRMEFVSVGGLVQGITLDSIYLGASRTRNPNLASLFYRMKLIESFGTGISKIKRSYNDIDIEPIFETAPGVFRVTLPNCNELPQQKQNVVTYNNIDVINHEKNLIMEYVREYGSISRKDAEDVLDSGTTKAFKVLKELCDSGCLQRMGNGKKVKYIL